MTEAEAEAVHKSEMRGALWASERLYQEANLEDEKIVLTFFLGQLAGRP